MQTIVQSNEKSRATGFSVLLKFIIGLAFLSSLVSCSSARTVAKPSVGTSLNASEQKIQRDFANILEVNPEEITQIKLYRYIDDWLSVKHKLGGNSKSGIDCSAFVGNIYREIFQVNLPRTSADMAKTIRTTKKNQLKEGDLVFFSFGKKRIDHVGIYLKNNRFVHVSTSKGVIVSKLTDPWYANYLVKYGYVD